MVFLDLADVKPLVSRVVVDYAKASEKRFAI